MDTLAVARNLAEPEDLVVDGGDVFFTSLGWGSVVRVGSSGGPTIEIATGQASPMRIAVDDTWVYWSNRLGGSIARTRRDGTGATEVVAAAVEPLGIAVDGAYVYWVDSIGVKRAPKANAGDGGVANGTLLLAGVTRGELRLEGGALFADVGDCNLWRIPTAAGAPTPLQRTDCSGALLFDVSLEGIWLGGSDLIGMRGASEPQPIEWRSADGFRRDRIAGPTTAPSEFAARGRCGVYETSSSGGVFLALRGSDDSPRVTALGTSPRRIVRSGGAFYFTDHGHDGASDGAIFRIPEP